MIIALAVLVWGLVIPSLGQGSAPVVPFPKITDNSLIFDDPDIKSYVSIRHDGMSDVTFLGARDYLVALDRALKVVGKVRLSASDTTVETCKKNAHPEENCHNFIKVLHEYYSPNNLTVVYACGTNAFDPICYARRADNISLSISGFSGLDKSPKNPHVPGVCSSWFSLERNLLFLATAFDDSGTKGEIIIIKMDPQSKAKRVRSSNHSNIHPEYAGTFQEGLFVYFVFSESAMELPSTDVSRIGRVCDDGDPDYDQIVSYTRIRLRCGDYNMVQGTYFLKSEFRLFATFKMKDAPGKSAICYYDYIGIQDAFNGQFLCQKNGASSPWEVCPARDPGSDSLKTCFGERNELDVDDRILMNGTIDPVCGGPIFEAETGFRLIAVKPDFLGYKAYVSDTKGRVWNLYIGYCEDQVELHETWQVVPDNESSKDINSLAIFHGQVHILTEERVLKIPVTNIIPTKLSSLRKLPTTASTRPNFPSIPKPYTPRHLSRTKKPSAAAKTISSFVLTVSLIGFIIISTWTW